MPALLSSSFYVIINFLIFEYNIKKLIAMQTLQARSAAVKPMKIGGGSYEFILRDLVDNLSL